MVERLVLMGSHTIALPHVPEGKMWILKDFVADMIVMDTMIPVNMMPIKAMMTAINFVCFLEGRISPYPTVNAVINDQ